MVGSQVLNHDIKHTAVIDWQSGNNSWRKTENRAEHYGNEQQEICPTILIFLHNQLQGKIMLTEL